MEIFVLLLFFFSSTAVLGLILHCYELPVTSLNTTLTFSQISRKKPMVKLDPGWRPRYLRWCR